jgi:uncharacterized protein (DUF2384 family)
MTAVAFDLLHPEAIAGRVARAGRALEETADTPAEVIELVEDLCVAIGEGDRSELASVNPWLWIAVQGAALRAQAALRREDPQRRRDLRLALAQLHFLLSRIADRREVGEDRPAAEIARWLEEKLPLVAQGRKARLLGVSLRTYQRRLAEHGTGGEGGSAAGERRLRVVARIVNQLRHGLTGPGVVEWFEHARPDLGGKRPLDLLDDAESLEDLLAAAAASRGNLAA